MALIAKRDLPFLGFSAAALGFQVLPRSVRLRWCHVAGRWLGAFWYRLDRPGAALVRKNLQGVLGRRLSAAQLDATARAHFQNIALGMLVNDVLRTLTLQDLIQFLCLKGEEYLEEALAQEQGVILLGAHFGLHSYTSLLLLKRLGYRVAAVLGEEIKPNDSWVYRHVVYPIRRRSCLHVHVIHPTGVPQREMIDCLQQNHVLMILGDYLSKDLLRLPPPQVLPAPLLGHSVPLNTGPFRLARWLGSPVVPFFIVPQPAGFALVIEPPLQLSQDNSTSDLMADLAAFTTRFEPYLLRYPALWANWRCYRLLDLMQLADEQFLNWNGWRTVREAL
jgi:lauroyl/myristoyl acyltransferase